MIALGGPFVDAAAAATRYVNIGGVDTGVCTTASPGCSSITYAMLNSVSGDTIQVGPGIYNSTTGETFPINPKDGVRMVGAGNAGRGTTTVCGNANTSCIDGETIPSYLIYYNVSTANPTNTIFEGFILQGVYTWGTHIGLYAYGPGTYAPTIRNNTMTGGWSGISLWKYNYSTSSTLAPVITNNKVTGTSSEAMQLRLMDPYATATPQITNNDLSSNSGNGIYIFSAENTAFAPVIQGNTITGNGWNGISAIVYPYAHFNGSISGNNISNNDSGIWMTFLGFGTEAPTISNNTINGNNVNGIYIFGQYFTYYGDGSSVPPRVTGGVVANPAKLAVKPTISGNTLDGNMNGITLVAADRADVSPTISGGSITNSNYGIKIPAYYNNYSYGGGIASPSITSATISNNTVGVGIRAAVYYSGYMVGYKPGGRSASTVSAPPADPYLLASPVITGSTLAGNNTGVLVSASNYGSLARPVIQNNSISGGFTGILVDAASSAVAQANINHNLIDGSQDGVYLFGSGNGLVASSVQNNTITNNSFNGIYAYGYYGLIGGAIKRNHLGGNNNGINLSSSGVGNGVSSVVSENTITGNGSNGIMVYAWNAGYKTPDLGGGASGGTGRNTIIGGSGFDIVSYASDALMAQDNWWSTPPTWTGSMTPPVMSSVNSNVLSFAISPASGGLGTPITLTANPGTRFVQSTGHLDKPILVEFDGMLATSVTVSADGKSLTALAPDGVVGTSDITITNPAGQSGTLVGGFHYTYSSLPSVPVLLAPYNGSTGVTSPVSFTWRRSADPKGGPVSYDLYLCNDPSFATCPLPVNGAPIASLETQGTGKYAAAGGGLGLALLAMVIGGAVGPRRRRAAIAAAMCLSAASLGIVACGDLNISSSDSGGSTLVTMSFGGRDASAIPDTVTSIRVLISGEGMNEIDEIISISGTTITETFEVPDGSNRHFEAFAQDALGQTLYYGDDYVDLMGLPVSVSLSMGPYNAVIYVYSGPLSANTTYYWKLIAKDSYGNPVESNVFSFMAQ